METRTHGQQPCRPCLKGIDTQRVSLQGPMVEWAYLAQTDFEQLAVAYVSLSCSTGVQTSRHGRHSGRYNRTVEDILQLRQAHPSCLLVQEILLPMPPTSERAKRCSTLSHLRRSSLYQDSHSKTVTAAVFSQCLLGIVGTEDPYQQGYTALLPVPGQEGTCQSRRSSGESRCTTLSEATDASTSVVTSGSALMHPDTPKQWACRTEHASGHHMQ